MCFTLVRGLALDAYMFRTPYLSTVLSAGHGIGLTGGSLDDSRGPLEPSGEVLATSCAADDSAVAAPVPVVAGKAADVEIVPETPDESCKCVGGFSSPWVGFTWLCHTLMVCCYHHSGLRGSLR